MKKLYTLVFAVAVIILSVPQVQAQTSSTYGVNGSALGVGAGISFGTDNFEGSKFVDFGNFHITGKHSSLPVMFGLDIGFGSKITGIDLSFDWWLFNPRFGEVGKADLSLYVGPGLDVSVGFGGTGADNPFTIALGGRVPVGLSWCLGSFEIFTEFVFTMHLVDFGIAYNDNQTSYVRFFGYDVEGEGNDDFGAIVNGAINVGFRYWF